MSASGRAPRRFKRWALFSLLVATACIGPLDDDSVGVTSPRYMDELCSTEDYTLQGSAVRTTGLTEDTCGFVLGPGPGSVSFEITIPADFDSYEVSALVTRNGHSAWETLGGADRSQSSGLYTVSTTGEQIEVVDVRLRGAFSSANCG